MNIKPIKSELDYRQALKKLEIVFDALIGTPESDEADMLGLIIDEYEKNHYHIDAPDPIEAIKIRMEEMKLKQKDLVLSSICESYQLSICAYDLISRKLDFFHLSHLLNQFALIAFLPF